MKWLREPGNGQARLPDPSDEPDDQDVSRKYDLL